MCVEFGVQDKTCTCFKKKKEQKNLYVCVLWLTCFIFIYISQLLLVQF